MQQALKKRLLIVDDESEYLALLSANLEATGFYEVRISNKPEEVLALARVFKPDLILLDLVMPKMNGTALAFEIRRDKELREVPILFMSGSNLDEIQRAETFIYQNMATALILKPASLETILESIEKTLAGEKIQ